jgi:hypothetical protein
MPRLPRLSGILQRQVKQLLREIETVQRIWEKTKAQITVITAAGIVLSQDDRGNPTQSRDSYSLII